MKKTLTVLPLLVLLLVVPATAEDSPEEKALLDELQQVEQKLMSVAKELRAATDPEAQKRLVADMEALHENLALLNRRREALRLASAKHAARRQSLQEEVTLSLDDLPVSEAVKLLTTSTRISIDVPPELARQHVTLSLKNRTRFLALMDIAGHVDCDLGERKDGSFFLRPRRTAERREAARRGAGVKEGHLQEIETLRDRHLDEKVNLGVRGVALADVVRTLTHNRRVHARIPPSARDVKVTLSISQVPRREALARAGTQAGLRLVPGDGEVVHFVPAEVLPVDEADLGKFIPDSMRLDGAPGELAKKLDTIKVSLQLSDVLLPQAVAYLAEPWEINVIIDPKDANTKVSLDVKDMTLHKALKLVGKAADLELRLDGETVRLVMPQSLSHWGHTHKGTGVKTRKGVLPPKWGFEWNKPHLEDLRRRLQKEKDPDKRADIEDEIRIREVVEKYRTSGLPQKNYSVIRVTMSFDDTPLSEAASRLAKAHGVEILVPRKLGERRISVDLKDRTLPAAVGGLALAAGGIASTSGRGLWVLWPVARLRPHHPIQKAARPPPRFRTQRADIRLRDPRRPPTPAEELRSLRDEIRALRAEIAEIKAILLRMR